MCINLARLCTAGNVFIHRNPKLMQSPESGLDSCEEDEEFDEPIIYKIGRYLWPPCIQL